MNWFYRTEKYGQYFLVCHMGGIDKPYLQTGKDICTKTGKFLYPEAQEDLVYKYLQQINKTEWEF